ncbi:MAG: F0F1 ATP synthase subunit B [Candidatus Uhrbacteria bacterium]
MLTKLGIDWRLLIAQFVNFFILFFLLRKFLFKPVLVRLTQRREQIAEGVRASEAADERLRTVEDERRQVLHRAELERGALLEQASARAEELRRERAVVAENEASAIIERAQLGAVRSRSELLEATRREIGDLVLAVAQKVTADTLSPGTQNRIIEQALKEMEESKL